jgi:hypothetical protein
MKALHFAARLRVVAKHRHIPRIAIDTAGESIQRAATDRTRTHEDQLMADELERVTGMRSPSCGLGEQVVGEG